MGSATALGRVKRWVLAMLAREERAARGSAPAAHREPITNRGQGRFLAVPPTANGAERVLEVAGLPPFCDGLLFMQQGDKHRYRPGRLSADKQQPPVLMADGGTVRWRPKGDKFAIATTEFISAAVNTIDDITPFRAARFDSGGRSFRNLRNFE